MQKSQSINITGTYQNLDALVVAALLAAGKPPWFKSAFSLRIFSPRTNAAGTRIQVTSDLVGGIADRELLPEVTEEWTAGGAIHNSETMLDKQIRILDGADVATTGTAVVSVTWA